MIRSVAAICFEPNKPLAVEEVQVAPPGHGEALVEIVASGLCHTDLTALEGVNATCVYPLIPGHEGAGRVLEVGEGVYDLKPGDHVIPLYGPECMHCRMCRSGRTNLCWTIKPTRDRGVMPNGTSRFAFETQPVHHFMGTSTLSRYTVVPEIALAKIRPDAPLDKVCLFGCGVTTGVGAALAEIREDDAVAVFGLGGIGINVVQGARLAGAKTIIGIDVTDRKNALARAYGMTDFVNAGREGAKVVQAIRDLTDGGVDVAFECTGIVPVMRQAFDCCQPAWGTAVLLGVEPPGTELGFPPVGVRYGRSIRGSYFGGVKGRSGLGRLIDFYMEGRLDLDRQITHTLALDEVNRGFDLMRAGETVRSVVHFE
ncbi:zinc-binding dehydrogenase [Mesorhizobium sp. B2-2-4]|nr:zinc-binding dehydrogenase [Mesorhizobium sp. B3-1-1]TPJ60280.1 zinc-binding dehydrogenase [Mesorhizobium sp. B2-6-1]TPJ60425.1 zinc-binding dehydrogenase [Mesorhizobium sp. B2-6-7]TPJ83436.1 zinc-binding dehydrogenase [Mesorhizobium sp. B2-6-3]TPJ94499.1 zinc-binding dehydrogenase [Mesorhizobium sp. B2-5-12]TPJ97496.1 zinc-binding dehydrogenase [Mesorhizobium sp. B2-5-10]TPK07245.1 zinc-binding dehydrogenase [Mesorhizobium sp. B2-5-11]TPK23198.1 zinc-binding dehydrogenase [Mesorhizobium 